MRPLIWIVAAAALTACAGNDGQATDSAGATSLAAAPAMPANLTAADVAGTWAVKGMSQDSDSTLVTYDLVATSDTSGWSVTFPDGQKVPMRSVVFSGDSVVSEAGPFNSQLRRGMRVRNVRSVGRLRDGKLVGTVTSRYETSRPDSVVVLRTEATRKP